MVNYSSRPNPMEFLYEETVSLKIFISVQWHFLSTYGVHGTLYNV